MAEDINLCRIMFGADDKAFPLPASERRRLANRDAEFAALQAHLQEITGLAERSARIAEAKEAVIEAAKTYADKSIDYDSGSVDYELRAAVTALIQAEGE